MGAIDYKMFSESYKTPPTWLEQNKAAADLSNVQSERDARNLTTSIKAKTDMQKQAMDEQDYAENEGIKKIVGRHLEDWQSPGGKLDYNAIASEVGKINTFKTKATLQELSDYVHTSRAGMFANTGDPMQGGSESDNSQPAVPAPREVQPATGPDYGGGNIPGSPWVRETAANPPLSQKEKVAQQDALNLSNEQAITDNWVVPAPGQGTTGPAAATQAAAASPIIADQQLVDQLRKDFPEVESQRAAEVVLSMPPEQQEEYFKNIMEAREKLGAFPTADTVPADVAPPQMLGQAPVAPIPQQLTGVSGSTLGQATGIAPAVSAEAGVTRPWSEYQRGQFYGGATTVEGLANIYPASKAPSGDGRSGLSVYEQKMRDLRIISDMEPGPERNKLMDRFEMVHNFPLSRLGINKAGTKAAVVTSATGNTLAQLPEFAQEEVTKWGKVTTDYNTAYQQYSMGKNTPNSATGDVALINSLEKVRELNSAVMLGDYEKWVKASNIWTKMGQSGVIEGLRSGVTKRLDPQSRKEVQGLLEELFKNRQAMLTSSRNKAISNSQSNYNWTKTKAEGIYSLPEFSTKGVSGSVRVINGTRYVAQANGSYVEEGAK